MNDRELLEAAARAAGIAVAGWDEDPFDPEYSHNHKPALRTADFPRWWWNPLLDDGDALRLAVKLRMDIAHFEQSVRADVTGFGDCHELNGADPAAAGRPEPVGAIQPRGCGLV